MNGVIMPRLDHRSENLMLVREIKKYPCLYDVQLEEYSNKASRIHDWQKVAEVMNDTVQNCKIKWRNLRTVYLRKLRTMSKNPRGPPYYLKDAMSFILPHVKLNSPLALDPLALENEEEPDEATEYSSMSPKQEITFEPIDVHDPPPRIKPKRPKPPAEPEYLDFPEPRNVQPRIPTDDNDDSARMFLLSLLPDVRKLTSNQMRSFRRKVLDALDDVLVNTHVSNV